MKCANFHFMLSNFAVLPIHTLIPLVLKLSQPSNNAKINITQTSNFVLKVEYPNECLNCFEFLAQIGKESLWNPRDYWSKCAGNSKSIGIYLALGRRCKTAMIFTDNVIK